MPAACRGPGPGGGVAALLKNEFLTTKVACQFFSGQIHDHDMPRTECGIVGADHECAEGLFFARKHQHEEALSGIRQ